MMEETIGSLSFVFYSEDLSVDMFYFVVLVDLFSLDCDLLKAAQMKIHSVLMLAMLGLWKDNL